MKKSYRRILSVGLFVVLIGGLIFALTGCGFLAEPTAKIEVNPTGTLSVGEDVEFDGSNSEPSDPDGEIVSYDWTFTDEFTPGTGVDEGDAVQTGSYDSTGTFDVTLTVTDDDGKPDTKSVEVEVE